MSDEENDSQEREEEGVGLRDDNDHTKKRRKRKRKRKNAEDGLNPDQETVSYEHANETTKEQEVDRTVYVEGIPYECSRDDVYNFFKQHLDGFPTGNEDGVPLIVDIRLPTWPDTGRLKGYGHVVFASRELQEAACALGSKQLYLKKRYLTIAPANAPSPGPSATTAPTLESEPSSKIVLHNLSYDATEDDISNVLESSHVVPGGIRIVRHNATRRSRGFAYVEFESVEHAKAATAKPIVVLGRPCRVDYDHGTVTKNFRTVTGRLWHKSYGKRQRES